LLIPEKTKIMLGRLYALISLFLSIPIFASAKGVDESINDFFAPITRFVEAIVFVSFKFEIGETVYNMPIVLIILILGALYFTIYFRFPNFRHFRLSLDVVRGKYSGGKQLGEVSHFQALTAALSGTVGLGNIAGVAVAVALGGPGATFWMIIAGLLGMSSKFVECTLGVKYREVDADGTVYGGPMYYLSKGFASMRMLIGGKEYHFSKMGRTLAVMFAIATIGGSLGGGNMLQVNQSYQQMVDVSATEINAALIPQMKGETVFLKGKQEQFVVQEVAEGQISLQPKQDGVAMLNVAPNVLASDYVTKPMAGYGFLVGLIFAGLVAVVIIGGIRSIARVTDKLVPFMCGLYILAALVVLFANYDRVPWAFGEIFRGAFAPDAIYGGVIGVLIQGFRRAAFSNEAGIGSASIAHSAVRTNYPASEGIVSLLEPFIDTVVICTMTAITIVVTGSYQGAAAADGISITSRAFGSVMPWFPMVLTVAVILFAFSTMISWSYYGSQAWAYLFGRSKIVDISFKVLFCVAVVLGASAKLDAVIGFSDAMIFTMLFPNMVGLIFLAPVVKHELESYLGMIRSGEIARVK
jgi:AGCS family alanine or glycine:cation symporter